MNYWKDKFTNQTYFATVVLTLAEHPRVPPMVISVPRLLLEERFVEVEVPETFDTSGHAVYGAKTI